LVTLIPTLGRQTLQRSLQSIANQTKTPDEVIIISEKEIEQYSHENLGLTYIQNTRTRNLSGAINTGIEYLLNRGWIPEETYITILDDDDEWEPTYLQKCHEKAINKGLDQVVAGIIRHTSKTESEQLEIPTEINSDIFLTRNPHIQGSNLFVKFSKILEAGAYDERLQSTTDRDICFRLFELDLKYDVINEHLVHHWALEDQNRLSDPSSPKKSSGLNAFYHKYSPIMSETQRTLFIDRAEQLFNTTIENQKDPKSHKNKLQEKPSKYFPIIIGFYATNLDTSEHLLKDIKSLLHNYPTQSQVVICDNSNDTPKLEHLIKTHLKRFKFYDKTKIDQDCEKGLFGAYLINPENRKGISSGRTILHRYIYDEMKTTPGSVAWVIDDDIRLESLQPDGTSRKITIDEINQAILRLKTQGISIANGKITGEPPIPFLSTIRTQMLDISYNIKKIQNKSTVEEVQPRIFTENLDYYYDLSDTNYTHLETPEYLNNIQSIDDIETWINQLLSGSNLSRPIVEYPHKISARIPPRGGNTLILNLKSIRDYPNISPRVGWTPFRRGDRFWCTLNYYHGGRQIAESQISVKQERTLIKEDAFSFSRLRSDFYGSAFVKAMEDHYFNKNKELGWTPRRTRLSISEESIEIIIEHFDDHLRGRVENFVLNAYRVKGLISIIKNQIQEDVVTSSSVHEELDILESIYSSSNIRKFRDSVFDIDLHELKDFLREMRKYVKSYREHISTNITSQDVAHTKSILIDSGLISPKKKIDLLGFGDEGAVFTDKKQVFKVFYYGKTGFPENVYDFVSNKMLNEKHLSHFSRLTEIIEKNGELIFVFPYEEFTSYSGDQLENIQDFLRESKEKDIVVVNLYPKNFILVDGIIKHVDIGRSIIPYNEKEYRQMCKRAYLIYRWHFRKDLSKLMELSLFNDNIPELFGYQYFLESIENKTKRETLDELVIARVTDNGPITVLDYGCGKGKISEQLTKQGCSVVGYDIDTNQIEENKAIESRVMYVDSEDLFLQSGKYEKVLCCLVLCTIESDQEVISVVKDLRKYVDDSGEVIVVICNPFNTFVKETETHIKQNIPEAPEYYDKFSYSKLIKETGNIRKETHRPFSYYEHLFHGEGFQISEITETRSTDVNELAPASDFLIIHLKPNPIHSEIDVSLLIKVSAMEWRSIDFQIKHIVNQLEGPHRFKEIIVITDEYNGPYLRQYTESNYPALIEKLVELKKEGKIDQVVVVKDGQYYDVKRSMNQWFNLDTSKRRCSNGQPTYTILKGFEEVQSNYFLHVDSDCLFVRKDRGHDYLGDMLNVLDSDERAISVSFNIAHEEDIEYSYEDNGVPWRVETRCSLVHKPRLMDLLPLPNQLDEDGCIKYPWHRSLDQAIIEKNVYNYRGGDRRTFFVHVPNSFKTSHNEWYNVVKAAERGQVPRSQIGQVNLQNISDWLNPVRGEFVILVRGLNVSLPKLRQCLNSIESQTYRNWNVVFIDAGSNNAMQEYLDKIAAVQFKGKCTFWFNHEQLTSMENIFIASKKLCSDPNSILIHLDADDAFINNEVLNTLKKHYDGGADLTVGSMLRTDKHKEYPVKFNPREARGGNVWQHLRSYKKHLFDEIPLDYFKINGIWIPIAEDWSFMVPLCELATTPVHIKDILYFYQPGLSIQNRTTEYRESIIKEIINKPSLKK
jgi:glycosyltransferase involved in cell wall biosynthesis/SAM-dependent methyltransferase